MSFGIVRVQKFKAGSVSGIQIHDNREKNSLTNPDIKREHTADNYHLKQCENFHAKIKENLYTLESKKAVRKDAVVMCQMLVTSDEYFFDNISQEYEKIFFKNALDFITKRYGEQNIISATVHKDEKTPHLHINFTPIRDHRLSAKAIFDRKELTQLQTDFFQEVGRKWGLMRGESREEKRRHLDVEEYKIQTRKENLKKDLELRGNINIHSHDVKPRIIKRSFLGMKNEKENWEEIGKRLTKKYIEPLEYERHESIKKHANFLKEISSLKKINESLLKDITELKQFKRNFNNLKKAQMLEIFILSSKYQKENEIEQNLLKQKIEKEQQQKNIEQERDALEKEKNARCDEQLVFERNKATRLFEKLLRETPGTMGQHIEQKKQLIKKWDQAENKADFEKAVKETLQPQKQRRTMRM